MPLGRILELLAGSKAPDTSDVKRRLDALEKSTTELQGELRKTATDLHNKVFDAHKVFTTGMFSLVALLLGYIGVVNRLDVNKATADVRQATTEMQNRVKEAIGDALKRPSIQIYYQGQKLDGQTFEVTASNPTYYFKSIFLSNDGERIADRVTIRLFATSQVFFNPSGDWFDTQSSDTNYPFCYTWNSAVTISAKDEYPIALGSISMGGTNRDLKLQVYYSDTPAVAKFRIVEKK
jgi:hypothetical protein